MSPIPGSNNSKEDEETIGPFPLSNFDAPHEHPTTLLHVQETDQTNPSGSNAGIDNEAFLPTENSDWEIPPIEVSRPI